MALTVEQKINMLILAGYEPCHLCKDARIVNGASCIHSVQLYRWVFVYKWPSTKGEYNTASWDELRLDTCPDELILEACKC